METIKEEQHMEKEFAIRQDSRKRKGFLMSSPPLEKRDGDTEAADNVSVRPWTCANAQFRVLPPDKGSQNRRKELVKMKEVAEEGINQTPYVEIEWIGGTKQKALFDTGAQWTLLTEELLSDKERKEMSESS